MKVFYKRLSVFAVLVFAGWGTLSAQFTIKRNEKLDIEPVPIIQNMPGVTIDAGYFDVAAWNHQKRRARIERNTIEFRANLQTSMQQYENWAGSEVNNFNGEATLYFRHIYKKEKFSLNYNFDVRYGMNVIDRDFFKNKDEFKFNLLMGWFMHANWNYSASLDIQTQLTPGYKSRTDKTLDKAFMAPGNIKPSVGFTYQKEGSPLIISLSPLTGSITTMWHDELAAAKDKKRVESSIGPSANLSYNRTFGKRKNYTYRTTFKSFTSYADPIRKPDIDWDNNFEIRLSRIITTSLRARMVYKGDSKDHKGIQMQYSFTLGLSYNYKNK